MAGGGGTSTTKSEFPPEFRPLAESAVEQIQALQDALPLSGFAASNPREVPGLAPFQQAALGLLPSTLLPTQGLKTLQRLPVDPTGLLRAHHETVRADSPGTCPRIPVGAQAVDQNVSRT